MGPTSSPLHHTFAIDIPMPPATERLPALKGSDSIAFPNKAYIYDFSKTMPHLDSMEVNNEGLGDRLVFYFFALMNDKSVDSRSDKLPFSISADQPRQSKLLFTSKWPLQPQRQEGPLADHAATIAQ